MSSSGESPANMKTIVDFNREIDRAKRMSWITKDKATRLRLCLHGMEDGTRALLEVAWDLLIENIMGDFKLQNQNNSGFEDTSVATKVGKNLPPKY